MVSVPEAAGVALTVGDPAYRYHPQVLEALAGHGLVPRSGTSPAALRDALRELYKYEIRRKRDDVLAGRIRRPDYASHIVELRKRYWLLSVPTELWGAPVTHEGHECQED